MRRATLALMGAALLSASPFTAALELNGVTLPDRMSVADSSLVLNGAGTRQKYFMTLYVAGLYLPATSREAEAIIRADEPQVMKIEITSSMVTRDRFRDTIQDGLKLSAGADYPRYANHMDALWARPNLEIRKGDRFEFAYTPGEGTRFTLNGEELTRVAGLDFKRVLFGIYLGQRPVEKGLKAALLGSDR